MVTSVGGVSRLTLTCHYQTACQIWQFYLPDTLVLSVKLLQTGLATSCNYHHLKHGTFYHHSSLSDQVLTCSVEATKITESVWSSFWLTVLTNSMVFLKLMISRRQQWQAMDKCLRRVLSLTFWISFQNRRGRIQQRRCQSRTSSTCELHNNAVLNSQLRCANSVLMLPRNSSNHHTCFIPDKKFKMSLLTIAQNAVQPLTSLFCIISHIWFWQNIKCCFCYLYWHVCLSMHS